MSRIEESGIICVGNANIDAFLSIHGKNVHCYIDTQTNELRIGLGEKILVDSSEFLLGGGAANVSVGLKRLGIETSLIAEIGDDEFAEKIRKNLEQERVNTSHLVQTKGASSSFSIGIVCGGERTLFVCHVNRKHAFSFKDLSASWVYLGGLGNEWEEAYRKTVEFAQANNIKLVCAPGTTQIQAGADSEALRHALESAHALFVNKEEAIRISNFQLPVANEAQMEKLLKDVKNLGPEIAVITDGENGSFAIDKQAQTYSHVASEQKAIERTGAGDGYASGFLAALMSDKTIEEAMRWGTKNAGSVIQKVGAQPGLLTRDEMEKS